MVGNKKKFKFNNKMEHFYKDILFVINSFFIRYFIESNLNQLPEVLAKRSVSSTPGIVLITESIYPPKSTSPRWNEE